MESTDMGQFGMNTPAFFAIDNLTYQIVPEPTAWGGAWWAMLAVLVWRRRTRLI
jgi:hypothetical protein